MTADDIEAWDLVSHITLIYAIEDEFGIKFNTRDLENLSCVGDLQVLAMRRASPRRRPQIGQPPGCTVRSMAVAKGVAGIS